MHGQELLNCLYFNDYRVVYEQIESVSVVKAGVGRKTPALSARQRRGALRFAVRKSDTFDKRFQAVLVQVLSAPLLPS